MQKIKEIQAINLLESKISSISDLCTFKNRDGVLSIEYLIDNSNDDLDQFYKFSNGNEKLEYLLLVSFIALSYKHIFGNNPFIKGKIKGEEELKDFPLFFTKIDFGTSLKETIRNVEKSFTESVLLLHDEELLLNVAFKNKTQELLDSKKGISFHYSGFTKQIKQNEEVLRVGIFKKDKNLQCELSSFSEQIDESHLYGFVYFLESYLKNVKELLEKNNEKSPQLSFKQSFEMIEIGRGEVKEISTKNIIEQFVEQVLKTPSNIALNVNGKEWTYQEIHERSNKVALVLQQKYNVKPGDKIGILLSRNEFLLISLLAIHKLGASYVPLDASYPKERIKFIYNDSGISILLVNKERNIQKITNSKLVEVETLEKEQVEKTFLEYNFKNNIDFYLVYTSGSTGLPKGCQITHKNVINLFSWAVDHYSEEELSSVLASTSVCFDLSIFELFLPLTLGGKIVLVENIMELLILKELPSISLINSIPSLVQELVFNKKIPKDVKVINLAGEPIQERLVNDLYSKEFNIDKIWNLYGPSETTTYSTGNLFQKNFFQGNCIGRPLYNTNVIVLNDELKPVPYGYPGELFIGGKGVSDGYWNRDELNIEKFIKISGFEELGVFYKTGDIVRWNYDQTLSFIGRSDNQVKIRGFRVELSEIEHRLIELNEIQQIKVFVLGPNNEAKIIACYQSDKLISHEILYKHCSKVMPKYMIPQEFVHFKEIFRTPNGKIDTNRLKEFCDRNDGIKEFVFEEDGILNRLIKIIVQISNCSISPETNLYEVGFTSIDFIKLLVRIENEFDTSVKVSQLFEEATPIAISESIRLNQFKQKKELAFAVQKELYPATFSQERFWLNTKLNSDRPELFNISTVIKWNKTLDIVRFVKAWNTLLKNNEILRTNFVFENGELYQKINSFKTIDIEIINQDEIVFEEIFKSSFFTVLKDLEKDSLSNIKLIKESETLYYILFNFHHSIIDGWSLELIFKQLLKFYNEGESDNVTRYQFKDYSEYYHQQLQFEDKDKQYWDKKIKIIKEPLQLFEGKKEASDLGGTFIGVLNSSKVAELKNLFRSQQSSLFQGIVSIIGVLLRRYGNEKNIRIGIPSANRPFDFLEEIPGMFLDVLFFHINLENNISFDELLNNVKEELYNTLDHQGYPVDALLKGKRNEGGGDFDVFVAHQQFGNFQEKKLEENVEIVPFPIKYAKHPLSFYFYEKGDDLEFFIDYQLDKISESEVSMLWSHFQSIIDVIIKDTTVLIDDISILDEEEEKRIKKFEKGINEEILPFTLFELFEKSYNKRISKNAVNYQDNNYSYDYCNQYAKIIHEKLEEKNKSTITKKNKIVAIDLPDGIERIAAILGVLRYGAIVLPIQPDFPIERKKNLLEEANVTLCITNEFSELYSEDFSIIMPVFNDKQIYLPVEKVEFEDGAWLIFTSGSTGKQKGVLLTHENIVNMFFWFAHFFQLTNNSVLPQKTNISFIDSIVELLLPLCITSGTVYLRPEEDIVKNANKLNDWFNSINITHVQFVPEIFDNFYSQVKSVPKSLDFLLLSGNKITKFHELDCHIYNVYGASETTAYVLSKEIKYKDEINEIGRPNNNTEVKIINESGSLVPIGIRGELYVHGKLIFKEYLNTEEQPFVKDISFKKWYKTNDIVSWNENGSIVFHGRKGNIVKVKGVRIDLSEIESIIAKIKGVKSAIAKVIEENDNDILIVFIHSEKDITLKEIQEVVKKEIPTYSRPTVYRLIKEIPYNSSGKINKKELTISHGVTPKSGYIYVESQTETERILIEMIKELTVVDAVSIEDNYFDLGIDSLSLVKLEKLVSEAFFKISITEFFSYTSIKSLAQYIDNKGKDSKIDFTFLENEFTVDLNRNLTNNIYEELIVNISKNQCTVLSELCEHYQTTLDVLINAFSCYGISNVLNKDEVYYTYINENYINRIQMDLNDIQNKDEFIKTFIDKHKINSSSLHIFFENIKIEDIKRGNSSLIITNLPLDIHIQKLQYVFDILIKTNKNQIAISWRDAYIPEEICYNLAETIMNIIDSFIEVENP